MKKSLLIIGGGFFGRSIIDYFLKTKKLKKKINKIIILTKTSNIFIPPELKKDYNIIKIKKDISKARKVIFANYVIYCAISKNYAND